MLLFKTSCDIVNMVKKHSLHNYIIKSFLVLLILLSGVLFTACSSGEKRTVVLSTGFNEDELFKIEDRICTLPEYLVYLYNLQDQYSAVYGEGMLSVEAEGETLKDNIKDNALADISQIKAMNIAAANNEIVLDEKELEIAKEAANDYFTSLSSHEIDVMQINEDILTSMYEEYALADKYYSEVIKDINPEISDDEARTITVLHILIKTYSVNGAGRKEEYSANAKKDAYEKAEEVLKLAKDGEHDFEELVLQYSDGEPGEYSFCKGETDSIFEEAAFNLGKDEISGIVTTEYGYHIIKCLSTFNREETDLNKIRIAEEQREEVFGKQYDDFAGTLLTQLNKEMWSSIDVVYDEAMKTDSFFEIYHSYFD